MNEEMRNEIDEEPEYQFRGWWIPVEIVELFEAGEINSLETLLLATIDSYVATDHGCPLSNSELGELLNVSSNHISSMVSKLKGVEINGVPLLRQVAFDGRVRELETVWSRIRNMHEALEPIV